MTGGQTGVDRAALDAAMELGIPAGGWCPKGRRAEDGRIPERYPLRETPSDQYEERTSWNVRDSDATLILAPGDLTGGTLFTLTEAKRMGRPHRTANPHSDDAAAVLHWLGAEMVEVLNVAGPRESTHPGVYAAARRFMRQILEDARRGEAPS